MSFAKQNAVDLIAMATHGKRGLGRLLAGSVAQDVLARANVPTLLVRAEEGLDEDAAERR